MQPRELDDLVHELTRAHPRFPEATVARLVVRTANEHITATPGLSVRALVRAVRRSAQEQLRYLDDGSPPAPPQRGKMIGATPSPSEPE
jgi:hypothetical protein